MELYQLILIASGGGVVFLFLLSQLLVYCRARTGPAVAGKHYLITGGSQGLGRSMALQLAWGGAKVTIAARGKEAAEETARLAALGPEGTSKKGAKERQRLLSKIPAIKIALGDVTDADAVKNIVEQAVSTYGPIDCLIPCAGSALTGTFFERSLPEYKKSMNLNYFGSLNVVYEVLPAMLERGSGAICIVSSALALTSYEGYAAYAPTKYALRGLADTLRNETSGSGVTVHIAYPPGMDTPGFEVEEKSKPAACRAIEKDDTVYKPEYVANAVLTSLSYGDYNIYCGAGDVGVLGTAANGMSPRVNPVLDFFVLPWLVLIAWVVRSGWDKTSQKHRQSRRSNIQSRKV